MSLKKEIIMRLQPYNGLSLSSVDNIRTLPISIPHKKETALAGKPNVSSISPGDFNGFQSWIEYRQKCAQSGPDILSGGSKPGLENRWLVSNMLQMDRLNSGCSIG